MKTFASVRLAILSGLFAFIATTPTRAEVIYSYTGLNFTNYLRVDTALEEPHITASVTFDAPLAANLSNVQLTPDAWQISDGSLTLTNLSPRLALSGPFSFSTDSNGNITAAGITVQQTWDQPINGYPGWNYLTTGTSRK